MDHINETMDDAFAELQTMKTTGDKILDRTLDKVGGKGLFVKELDLALQLGRVDITVHSLKDVPMELTEGLPLIAFSKREDPRDVLILPEGVTEMDPSKPIGSSSLRRVLQLKKIFPDYKIEPDFFTTKLRGGDIILLCTDGLYGEVSNEEIIAMLSSGKTMGETCYDLIETANENGGNDNITLICLKLTEDDLDEQ